MPPLPPRFRRLCIVIPWGCTHSSILSVHSCVATCMCLHTTPCSCVIVVHTSSASATLRSSHAQYRWAGCQHPPLDILCNGLLSSQAILQAASWPSPSFHKHTGDPTSCYAENHVYLSQSRCLCTRPLQPPKVFVTDHLDRIQHGFHIGLAQCTACCSSSQKSTSALEHSYVVDAFTEQQLAEGYMSGPFLSPDCSALSIATWQLHPRRHLANGTS